MITVNHHPVNQPKANYNADGSIILHTGAGDWHFNPADDVDGDGPFTAADVARRYLAVCIQAVGRAEAAEKARREATA
jgi:hypothetical protein